MFILDDLLFRPFVGIVNALHSIALDELYDVEALEADLKENQLLYELGERDEDEYRRRKERLEADLDVARDVHERLSSGRVEVKR
ncbi:gas-vesicle operon protein gvpG1 [Natrinema pellirubrum DSM 15624]|uniref:Gas vesicle protein G n=1 Tax=Natrinema pellirubrum (strain DSM 15624 / CIP 106293 / JCM 10476 / NCIMB 786 / 157) TaxID=797303 RepID=L0JJR1_NATP1|nr:gas vesicle protein GvpG [Natrinema pellirubrum]AGB31514.1 Gas vesicle protein G [Natrinema pellirubrum DSM 15624]ELY73374.1 gas-vesicle operon protein gvpG1 [Natrinema pellirubrum DSM 15624]